MGPGPEACDSVRYLFPCPEDMTGAWQAQSCWYETAVGAALEDIPDPGNNFFTSAEDLLAQERTRKQCLIPDFTSAVEQEAW